MAEENQSQDTQTNVEKQEQAVEKLKDEEVISIEKYNEIKQELDEVKEKLPKEKSEQEQAIEEKENELFQKEVNIELKSAGLEQFADFFNVQNTDELKEKIEKFQGILNEMKLDNSYQPTDHKNTDEYSNAKSKGDTLGMIKSLFSSN